MNVCLHHANACDISHVVRGVKALRHLGRLIVMRAMPLYSSKRISLKSKPSIGFHSLLFMSLCFFVVLKRCRQRCQGNAVPRSAALRMTGHALPPVSPFAAISAKLSIFCHNSKPSPADFPFPAPQNVCP